MPRDNLPITNKAFMRDLRRRFDPKTPFSLQQAFKELDARNPGKYGRDAAVFGSYMARAVGVGGVTHDAGGYRLVPLNQIDHTVDSAEQRLRAERRAQEDEDRRRQLERTITVADAERMAASVRADEARHRAEDRAHFEAEIEELRTLLTRVQSPTRYPLSLAGLSQNQQVRRAVARSLMATNGLDWVAFDVWRPELERHLGWVGHPNNAIARTLQGMLPFGEIERAGEPGAFMFRVGRSHGISIFGVREAPKVPLPPLDTMGMICAPALSPFGIPVHLTTAEELTAFFLSYTPGDGPIFIRG